MCGQYHWLFAFIFLCRLIVIRCDSDYCESENEICVERHFYDNADNTSFAFRYQMEDGSLASGSGELIDGDEHRLQRGHFRFKIREKPYEFKYEIDESVDHCLLTSVSSNGTMIEEKYENSRWIGHNFSFYHHQVYNGSEFFGWNIELLLPENENHPAFFCRFQSHSNVLKSRINCVTYENRNESVVGNTPNKPRHKWQEDFLRYSRDTLSWRNYHDGMGAYSLKYKFDEALIAEFGKLNADNTVSFVNGFMAFGGLHLNYTANATACNVSLYYTNANGYRKQKQFSLQHIKSEDYQHVYSDGKDFRMSAIREQTYLGEQAFIRGLIVIGLSHPGAQGLTLIQTFKFIPIPTDYYYTTTPSPISPEALLSLVGKK